MKGLYFKFIDDEIVECDSLYDFGMWFESTRRSIERTEFGNYLVSTVFLGIKHPPNYLFETMVFCTDKSKGEDEFQVRYETVEEARSGHQLIVECLKAGGNLNELSFEDIDMKKKAPPVKVAAPVKKATKKKVPVKEYVQPTTTVEETRDVEYPEIQAILYVGDEALTVEDAKKLLGWTEDSKSEPLKKDFLFKDVNGKKIKCFNNLNNRPFSMANAVIISQEILRGKWKLNGESMIIGRTGLTLSCQHRLIGFILACQEYSLDPSKYVEFWNEEPTLECIIVYGISEVDDVVNTMDTGRPRTLTDVIYRSEYFADLTQQERKEAAKSCQYATNLLWKRTGVEDAHGIQKTHSEALAFIQAHPRILECVNLIREDNEENQITHFITPGYAAALLYLMGSSKTLPKDYYSKHPHDETQLDWDLWDTACDFWVNLASGSKDSDSVILRKAFMNLIPEDGGEVSKGERIAVILKAWNLIATDKPLTEQALRLKYKVDEEGYRQLLDSPTAGGIDMYSGKDIPESVQTQ